MRKLRKLLLVFMASATAALVLSACGGDDARTTSSAGQSNDAMAASEPAQPPAKKLAPRKATVKMGEWYFKTDRKVVGAGKVTLVARNDGQVVHELMAVRTNRAAHKLPMHDGDLDLDRAGKVVLGKVHHEDKSDDGHGDEAMESGDAMEESSDAMDTMDTDTMDTGHLEGGESKRYRVKLGRGKYVLFCSIPGHYKAGQYASLTVQ